MVKLCSRLITTRNFTTKCGRPLSSFKRLDLIIMHSLRLMSFVVSCSIYSLRTYNGILSWVDAMFFSTREEELPKHFSKNSWRRRESKKNADEKKRGEEKRKEEGMFVVFSSSSCFGYNLRKWVWSSLSSFKRAALDDFCCKLYMTVLVTLERYWTISFDCYSYFVTYIVTNPPWKAASRIDDQKVLAKYQKTLMS